METSGGKLLKAWREGAGLSQLAFAGRVGVGQSAIAEWERDTRRPELHTAVAAEAATDGAVPVESWGYDASVVEAMAAMLKRRDPTLPRTEPPPSRDSVPA